LEKKANTMLAAFSINKTVNPYKRYVNKDEIGQMAESYKINPKNLSALSERMKDWNGDSGGVDENGLYGISTKNPDGKIDAFEIFAEVRPGDRGKLLFGEGDEKVCHAIVTPDGTWNSEGPWVYGSPNADQEKELTVWIKKMSVILDKYKDAAAFVADCHI
jgi:hypothetical protein